MKSPRFILSLVFFAVMVLPQSAKAQLPWTVVTPAPTSNNLTSVTYGNGLYVAVSSNATIITSPDGINWTQRTFDTSLSLGMSSVTYGNGRFVAISNIYHYHSPRPMHTEDCFRQIYSISSADGVNWTTRLVSYTFTLSLPASGHLPFDWVLMKSSISFGNNIFVAAYTNLQNSSLYLTFYCFFTHNSTDGLVWSDVGSWCRDMSDPYNLHVGCTVSFVNGRFIETGFNGLIRVSPDASAWITRDSGTIMNRLHFSTYGNGVYLAGGDSGALLASPDDSVWTVLTTGISTNLKSTTYNSGQFIIVGDSGAIFSSSSGMNWTVNSSGTTNDLNSIATNGSGRFVAVGNAGTIVVADVVTRNIFPKNISPSSAISISGSSGIVHYSLPTACRVSLIYYDLRGRLVATLVNAVQGAGYYTLSVKNALPSRGTYIRVFEAGSFIKRDLTVAVGK